MAASCRTQRATACKNNAAFRARHSRAGRFSECDSAWERRNSGKRQRASLQRVVENLEGTAPSVLWGASAGPNDSAPVQMGRRQ